MAILGDCVRFFHLCHTHTHTHTHTHHLQMHTPTLSTYTCTADFVPPPQPHSLGSLHYATPTKHGGRQDSTQSDSVMLMPFSNPSLALHHKSGSDLNLPGHESQKNSGMYVGSGVGGTPSELGWLDLDSSNMLSLSPTLNMFGGMGHHSSNPGSLPHEQFHLGFLDVSSDVGLSGKGAIRDTCTMYVQVQCMPIRLHGSRVPGSAVLGPQVH